MTIQKKDLLNSLKMAMPGIESGTATLQGADSFVFHDGRIFSYNDSISVSIPLSSAGLVEDNIEGAVKADEFYKVISKFAGEEINFAVNENKSWVLKCGKAKVEMTLIDFDYETRLKGIQPSDDWVEINEDFISGLGICRMSVNKTPLSGIYVNGKNIVSTDGFQINKYQMKENELPCFWLSDNSVSDLLKVSGLKFVQLQGNWVHFKSEDGVIFSAKVLNVANFPYDKAVRILDTSNPKEDDLHAYFPKELFSAIDRATSFSIDISEHSAIRLNLSKEHIEVSSERTSGKYTEKVAWDTEVGDFEPITVYVDSTMMAYSGDRSLEFYLIKGAIKNGKTIPRLLFTTEQSVHLMSTFDNAD